MAAEWSRNPGHLRCRLDQHPQACGQCGAGSHAGAAGTVPISSASRAWLTASRTNQGTSVRS